MDSRSISEELMLSHGDTNAVALCLGVVNGAIQPKSLALNVWLKVGQNRLLTRD